MGLLEDAKKWVVHTSNDAAALVGDILKATTIDPVAMPILAAYWKGLEGAAAGRWKSLPPHLVATLQPYYRLDLALVRYAERIDTLIPNTAVTIGLHIFFPRAINLGGDMSWLCHELTHCEQYVRMGDVPRFFHEYVPQVLQKVVDHRSFNVHDVVPLEAEANLRMDSVLATMGVTWVAGPTPPRNAIVGGHIADTPHPVYVGRAYHGANAHPGKVAFYRDAWHCFIGNGGREEQAERYELLVGDASAFRWSAPVTRAIPPRAVIGGHISDTPYPVYIGRARHDGNVHPGKVAFYRDAWRCFIGNGGREEAYDTYEVLTRA